jgi:cytochrome b561
MRGDTIAGTGEEIIGVGAWRYDGVSIGLHWLTLLLIILLFGTAWVREQASDGDSAALLLRLHRSIGLLIWLVTLGRLAWKFGAARMPRLPGSMPRVQRWTARANEAALYALLIVQPMTGVLQSIARGKGVVLIVGLLPVVMARDKALTHLAHGIHETGATLFLGLIALHTLAALAHGLVLRDGVLHTMLPFLPKGGPSQADSKKNFIAGNKAAMPRYTLSDPDLAALARYVRTLPYPPRKPGWTADRCASPSIWRAALSRRPSVRSCVTGRAAPSTRSTRRAAFSVARWSWQVRAPTASSRSAGWPSPIGRTSRSSRRRLTRSHVRPVAAHFTLVCVSRWIGWRNGLMPGKSRRGFRGASPLS